MTVQFIRTPQGGELAVLPREDYEDLVDGRIADEAMAALARGEEEALSSDEVRALLDAPTPLAFWRAKRALPAATVAGAMGVPTDDLASIEEGRLAAPLPAYRRAAELLRVPLDDLAID